MDIKLKEEIVNSVLKNEKSFSSRLHLIRSIYNEYNLRISYDYTWLYRNKSVTKEMFNSTVSFDSLSCNKLSCNEWCQLFYELLIFFGISENDILIKSKNYTHKWVEIKLDNMRLIADGTTNYNGHQDIYNCKINDNTSGFVLIENSIPCASLEDLYKAGIIDDDYIETCCRLLLDGSNLFYCEKQQLLLGDVDYNEFKSNMTFVKKS